MSVRPINFSGTINNEYVEFNSLTQLAKHFGITQATACVRYKRAKGNKDVFVSSIEELLRIKHYGHPCRHEGCTNRTDPNHHNNRYCTLHQSPKYVKIREKIKRDAKVKRNKLLEKEQSVLGKPKKSKRKAKFKRDPICITCKNWVTKCLDIAAFGSGILPENKKECFQEEEIECNSKGYIKCGGNISTSLSSVINNLPEDTL